MPKETRYTQDTETDYPVTPQPASTENPMPPTNDYPAADAPTPLGDSYPVPALEGEGEVPDDMGDMPARVGSRPSEAQDDLPDQTTDNE